MEFRSFSRLAMRNFKSTPPNPFARSAVDPARSVASFRAPFDPVAPLPQELDVREGPGKIYLSPHHDDACFSLGGLAHRRRGGWLVNIFTQSDHVANVSGAERTDIGTVTKIRSEEDMLFATECEMNVVDLGLSDSSLLGGNIWDPSRVRDNCNRVRRPLLTCLQTINTKAKPPSKALLFCPAGIGGHVDHVATMLTIARALPELLRRYRVLFYEDLHYASDWRDRQVGLLRLCAAVRDRRGTRYVFNLGSDADAKLSLIRLYRSQFSNLPDDCRRYSPAVEGASDLFHEAVWEFP